MIAFNRGGWGWLVLGLVLLVPLLSFFKWWQGMNGRRRDVQAKAPARSAFSGTAAAPLLPPASPAAAASPEKPAAVEKPGAAKAAAQGPKLGAAVKLASAGPSSSPEGNSLMDGPGFAPKTDRDPTLSPADIKRMQEPKAVRRGPGRVEDRIEVNGIINVTGKSVNAIVNGERVRKDDEVLGARIVRISANCVEFEYRKKAFKKCIQ